MSSVLVVGGDQILGIKQVLANYGVDHIHHWTGRKSGDSNRVIPNDTAAIVLITNWINHSITHKIKRHALNRGIQVIYTPNGAQALHNRLRKVHQDLGWIDLSAPMKTHGAYANNLMH